MEHRLPVAVLQQCSVAAEGVDTSRPADTYTSVLTDKHHKTAEATARLVLAAWWLIGLRGLRRGEAAGTTGR